MSEILNKVRHYIEDNHMLAVGEHVVVGVSGGADSMCLLFVLMTLRAQYQLTLHVVHINHGIRGEDAKGDQQFVENFCKTHGLLWKSFETDILAMAQEEHLSCEEAGRIFRYRCFEQVRAQIAGGCAKIAVAHNKNDAAETVLLNLFRGSGIRGLGGIAPVRGTLIRPILCLERTEIETLLAGNHISYCTDQTNFSNDYTRNRIRNEVLPYVTEHVNANVTAHLWQTAQMAAELSGYLQQQSDLLWPHICREDKTLDVQMLKAQHKVMICEIIRRMIDECCGSLKDISQVHIEQVAGLLQKQVGKRVDLPYGLRVVRGYEQLQFIKVPGKTEADVQTDAGFAPSEGILLQIPPCGNPLRSLKIPENQGVLEISLKNYDENQRIIQKQYTKWLDYDKIKSKLCIRHRCSGDYMIVDERGSKKLLRRILIDEKIPEKKRDQLWLIADDAHIVWMIGGRISDAYKVTPQTKRIIEIKFKGDEYNGR